MRVVIFGLSFLATLVALDVYLQAAGIQTPMETRIDPRLGPTYIPNMPIVRFNEGFYLGAANRYGYMGPAVPPAREGAEKRVLLLGDSFVLGHTVLPRHHFARTMEARLGETTGGVVRVLNFGKADFNLSNMYQYYHDFAGTFDHEAALFCVDEDDLVPARQIATDLYPTVRLEGDSLVIDTSFTRGSTYRFYTRVEPLLTRSAVLRLAFNSYKMVKRGELKGVVLGRLAAPRGPAAPVAPPRLAQALPPLSRAILRNLAADPRNLLVTHTALSSSLREEIAATGIPVIDLCACLDSLRAAGLDPNLWPVTGLRGHWNHATHPVVARFLADELTRRHLLDDAAPRTKAMAN